MADRPLTTGEGNTADFAAISRRWYMGYDRGAHDYTDAGCRVLAEHGFRDVHSLLAECERLRAFSKRANDNCVSLSEQLDAARQALTYIAGYQSETQSDAEGVTLM